MIRERRFRPKAGAWSRGAGAVALAAAGISAIAILLGGPSQRPPGADLRMGVGLPAEAVDNEGIGEGAGAAKEALPGERPVQYFPRRGKADVAGTVPVPRAVAPFPTAAELMASPVPLPLPDDAQQGRPLPVHEFYFTRMAYSAGGGGFRRRGRNSWATDYPKSDRQFLTVLERLTGLDMFLEEHPRLLTDEQLNRFPFLYAVEVGAMSMGPEEASALREFLLRGGFLVVDDFWGTREWENFEYEMQKVFPEYPIVDMRWSTKSSTASTTSARSYRCRMSATA